jgi:SAM-dependent methyltransferase
MPSSTPIDVTEIMRDIRERVRLKQSAAGAVNVAREMPPASSMLAAARASLSELHKSAEHIDHLPPQPPTFRGAVGATLSRFVQRLLFWQYAQARSFQLAVIGAIEQLLLNSDAVSSRNDQLEATLRRTSAKIQGLTERTERSETAMCAASETAQRLIERAENLSKDNERLQTDLSSARQKIAELSNVVQAIVGQIDSAGQNTNVLRQEIENLKRLTERVAALDRYGIQTRRNVILQEQRITSILTSVRKRQDAHPDRLADCDNTTSAPESMAGLYLALEDAFRGSPEEIAERVSVYLPIVEQAGLKPGSDLVIDIGCGRGEWLGLLAQNGYRNQGCDSNESMVSTCRERGLDVVQQDGLQFLHSLQADSVAAISAFHVIEHLPLEVLLSLIDGSLRALRPGGVLILETPNPQNILVASHNFYIDPTHQKPIPVQLLQFLVEARGFCGIQSIPLHPYPQSMLLDNSSEVARRFNEYFYGPQDYAILAKKP